MSKIRKYLYAKEAELLGFELKENEVSKNRLRNQARYYLSKSQWDYILELRESDYKKQEVTVKSETKSNSYKKPFVLSAWNKKGYMMEIDEYCNHYNLPRKDVQSYKLVSHTGTPFYNIVFKEIIDINELVDNDFMQSVIEKYIQPISIPIIKKRLSKTFDRLIYTDAHIGMTPDKNGTALYGGKWDEVELKSTLDMIVSDVVINKTGDLLVIDDLGDFLDGWNGETVRKGHKLPQNMTNKEMFDVGLNFKVKMIDMLVHYYPNIIVNNIVNDNHAGDFGYIVNSAFKSVINQKYPHIEVNIHEKFISHYFIGKHAFVISHGKDSHALKFGFKPQLDTKQVEKIDQYLKANDIYRKAQFIEFSKGDSHQMLFDFTTSDDFDYCNYPALSPSSEWIQTNYKQGRRGFVIQSIDYNERNKGFKPIII